MELQAFTGNVRINLGLINLSYRGRARHVTNNADLAWELAAQHPGDDVDLVV